MGNNVDTASLGEQLYNISMRGEKSYAEVRRLLARLTSDDQRREVLGYKDKRVSEYDCSESYSFLFMVLRCTYILSIPQT